MAQVEAHPGELPELGLLKGTTRRLSSIGRDRSRPPFFSSVSPRRCIDFLRRGERISVVYLFASVSADKVVESRSAGYSSPPCRRVVECREGPARSDDTADGSDGRGTDNLVSDFGAGGVSVSNPSLFFDGYTAIIADDPSISSWVVSTRLLVPAIFRWRLEKLLK